ncbi:reverse transcriptase domain-containing protein [Tanacetum coccineum]
MEKSFQIFQDLRFDISFADALILMPRFAPTIKSLLVNKEKLLELAKIPLNKNCSVMLLKKLGDPGKFLIPCNFPGMDLSLPDLTPTRMTLELADRSITHPKGLTEDIFVKVGNFHFPTDFVVVDFEADPRVPLILGRSFLRTSRALIDVYKGELVLRDGNEQITFHVNGTSKHPQKLNSYNQKHKNESIKMVNDACKDSFKRFTDEPTQVCPPPSEDVNNEKEKQEESIFHSNKTPQVSSVFAITSTLPSIEPKDSLIMGDEHLSTFSTEEIVPIPRESEETSRSDSKNVLPSCDDFSSINVPRDNSSTFLVTPLSDSNKDESLIPRDDIEFLLHDDPSTPLKSVISILKGFINDPPFEENNDLFDLEYKTNDEDECFNLEGDNDEIDAFLAIEVPTHIEGYYDSEGDVTYLESLLSEDTTHNLYPETPIGCTPYKLVYGKSCHLPIELEHKAYWALKHANFDLKTMGDHRKLQLNELNELRDQAYENSLIYKERTKKLHDSKIKNRIFNVGDRVLLFNSRLKIFSGKLKTRWSGPFTITKVFPYGTIELSQPDGPNFKVNGHRVKHYFGGDLPPKEVQDLHTLPKDE